MFKPRPYVPRGQFIREQVALGDYAEHPSLVIDHWQRVYVVIFDHTDELTEGHLGTGDQYLSCHDVAHQSAHGSPPTTFGRP
jgi:hypothetical protein